MRFQLIGTIREHLHRISSLAIAPDNKTLISSSWDSTVKIWDLWTGELIHNLTGHSDIVWSVAISSDGKTLATGSRDTTIKIYNLQTGKLIRNITGHNNWERQPDQYGNGQAKCLAISPDCQLLACAREYGDEIQLFNLDSGELIKALPNGWEPALIAFSADGKLIAACLSDSLNIWRVPTLELRCSCNFYSFESAVAISPDFQIAVSSYYKGGGIRFVNPQTGTELNYFNYIDEDRIDYSSDREHPL